MSRKFKLSSISSAQFERAEKWWYVAWLSSDINTLSSNIDTVSLRSNSIRHKYVIVRYRLCRFPTSNIVHLLMSLTLQHDAFISTTDTNMFSRGRPFHAQLFWFHEPRADGLEKRTSRLLARQLVKWYVVSQDICGIMHFGKIVTFH